MTHEPAYLGFQLCISDVGCVLLNPRLQTKKKKNRVVYYHCPHVYDAPLKEKTERDPFMLGGTVLSQHTFSNKSNASI